MNLQIIKSIEGHDEYVLLPITVYHSLQKKVEKLTRTDSDDSDYVPFVLEDYVKNPIALARIKTGRTQEDLAQRMGVSQAYISKLEKQETVTAKMLAKVMNVLK